jgi:hypothetical protein
MMLFSQHFEDGRQLAHNHVLSKTQIRTNRITNPTQLIIMMVVVILLTIDVPLVVVVHAFIPSASILHQRHSPVGLCRDRTVPVGVVESTTAASSDNEQMDRPLDLSTSDHDIGNIDSSSSMNQIINLTNKDISQMSFRELQRHVRILMMNNDDTPTNSAEHPKKAEEITRGMTTSILREKIRSLSNLCMIRDDGVEDCSFDDEQVNHNYV